MSEPKPKQKTSKGLEIPVPTKGDFDAAMRRVAPPVGRKHPADSNGLAGNLGNRDPCFSRFEAKAPQIVRRLVASAALSLSLVSRPGCLGLLDPSFRRLL